MCQRIFTFLLAGLCGVGTAYGANLTVSQNPQTGTNYTTVLGAWANARTTMGNHTITIQDNGPGGTGYVEGQMRFFAGGHVATSITITADPGVAPTIEAQGMNARIFSLEKNGFTLTITGAAANDRITLLTNNDPAIAINNAQNNVSVSLANVEVKKAPTSGGPLVNLSCAGPGAMSLTDVSFLAGDPANTDAILVLGSRNGSAATATLDRVDFSGADGTAARIRVDGRADLDISDSVFAYAGLGAPALAYDVIGLNPDGSNFTFRDCSFESGTARLFDAMGHSNQASPNIYKLYRPVFTGDCGATMFNIADSKAEVYVLGLDDSDQPTVPRVSLDWLPDSGTTNNIAALGSGKISLQYVEASAGMRNLVTAAPVAGNTRFEMIGCEWLNGTGKFQEGASSGAFAPQIDYENTVFASNFVTTTFIQAAGWPRTAVANIDLTHVTMSGSSLVFIQAQAIDLITASASIFDATSSITGVAPIKALLDGGVPNVSICPSCPLLSIDVSGWSSVPPSTIIANPNLSPNGRLTAASAAAIGAAAGSTETLDIDLDARPLPAGTTNDIGADEASFPPTDIAPNTMTVEENAPVTTLVATLTVTDPDVGEAYLWFLDDDAGGRFALNNASGKDINVEVASVLDAGDGAQTIDVRVRDSEGQEHSETLTINVLAAEAPVITLNDPGTTTVECGGTWLEPGATATDNVDGTFPATVGGDVVDASPANAGTVYTVTYNAQDTAGNVATEVQRLVTVVDMTPPTVILTGAASVVVECGTGYSDPGGTASDGCDPAVVVVPDSTITTSTPPGVYVISYDAQDASANMATPVTRTVEVADTTPPVIGLIGLASVSVSCGAGYPDDGATAADVCDPAVTVSTGGDVVGTSTPPGTYTITYDAQDATGNMAVQVTRSVTVSNDCPLTVTALGATEVTKLEGESHSFEVSVSGAVGGTTIQWLYDDGSKALQPILGENGTTLALTNLAGTDSGDYVCQVTDDVTVAQSPVFNLTVSGGLIALGPMGIASLVGLLALAGVTRRKK